MKSTVLITGIAGGIGQAIAQVFYRAGWYTIGIDKVTPGDTSRHITRFIQADLSNPESISGIFIDIQQQENQLDALINNAAVQLVKPLVETEWAEWDRTMAINVRAAYLMIKNAYPLMRHQGGSIVNVSSVHAIATSENLAAYVTSKGALTAMTRAAALELAKYKIRVNAVLPGAVDTEMLRSGLSRGHSPGTNINDQISFLARKHAVQRIGNPIDIAEYILFLADEDKASFITGQTLIIDGGATARLSTE